MESNIIRRPEGQDTLVDIRMNPQRFPRLLNIPEAEAVTGLAKIVTLACMYRGQEIDAPRADFTARTLRAELLEDDTFGAKFVTLEEIRRAVKKAVLNDSELYGINVASLYKIVMAYVKGEGHLADAQAHAIVKEQNKARANTAAETMVAVYAGKFTKNNRYGK